MPTDDHRLEQALHDAAPAVATADVVGQVAHRRTRRRRTRRLTTGALALVALLVVGTVTVLVTRDDGGGSPHVAAPATQLRARVVTGDGAVDDDAGTTVTPRPVTLDQDPGLLRAPVVVGATAFSLASYDRGAEGVAASHVVRIDGTRVLDVVAFKATRVLSIADGEGARWALTQNHTRTGGTVPDAFLKRIAADGEFTDTQLPLNADPIGPIAAVGGAVWVPVRDGVLQYDSNGAYVRRVPLPDADTRWVAQVGKLAYVTDGRRLHGLDPTGAVSDTITLGPEILGLATANFDARVLLAAEDGGREHARVALARTNPSGPTQLTAVLPDGFVADGLAASTTRLWATGTVDGSPAIALLDADGVRATVVLEGASDDATLAWTGAHTVRAVSGGALHDIAVP